MPQCLFPVFCCFCVSEKLHRKYSRNLTKQKPNIQILNEASRTPKRRRSRARGQPHHRTARPAPGPHPLWVRPPWSTSDAAPSPIKNPRREKPKYPTSCSCYSWWRQSWWSHGDHAGAHKMEIIAWRLAIPCHIKLYA
jgi:hypothetical protein